MTTVINSKNTFQGRYGGTDLTGVKESNVQVKMIGRTIFLRDSCYTKTNHFIKETQAYSKSTLHCYWYFSCARWLFLVCALIALGSVATLFISVPLTVVMLAWLVVTCQHCVVSCCTLPLVLRQPVVPGQQKLNQLYEVRVEELTGVLLQAHEAGIGYVEARTGRVKLQTFSPSAVGYMQRARVYSLIMLVVSLLLFLYAAGSSVGLGWNKYSEEMRRKYCEALPYDCVSCLNNTDRRVSYWLLHYNTSCAFTLDLETECLGACRVPPDEDSEDIDERSYTRVSTCKTNCVRDAEVYMDCTEQEIDGVCGITK